MIRAHNNPKYRIRPEPGGQRGPTSRLRFVLECGAISVFAAVLLLALPARAAAEDHFADPETAVEGGREALGRSWSYPWYDSQADDVRRVDVRAPRDPFSWLNFKWLRAISPILADMFRWLLWFVAALIAMLVVYAIIRGFLERDRRAASDAGQQEQRQLSAVDRVEELPFGLKKLPPDLLQAAREHQQRGDYRQAIICLFSYQLLELDRAQLIALGRGKTNRQYLRELRSHGRLAGLVEQTVIAFEDVFFGNYPLPAARFELCWSSLDEFHRLVQGGSG